MLSNKHNNKKVLAVGRLCKQKGFDSLIKIWQKLPSELKSIWHLDIVGEGQDKEELKSLIKEYELEDSISLKGHTSDIEKEYKSHQIFCFPSRYEGFPLALLEAMSHSMPCVAFNCPCGPADLIENGQTGFLIPLGDFDLFKETLISLMNDSNLQKHIGDMAYKNISKNYNEDTIMEKWISLFSEVITA